MSTASEDAKIVQAFSRDVNQFKGLVSKVGTSQDSVQLRRQIHSLAETARTKAHDAKRRCEPNAKSKDSATKVQYSRLITQLMNDVKSLTSSENELKLKEREHPTPPQGSRGVGGGGGFSSGTWGDDEPRQNQAQTVQQTQAFDVQVYDETKERAEQLNQLESNMKDLNEMFLEMGTLVADQGEALDLIETNVERAGMSVEHAKEETSKALTLKEKIRKKKGCCIVCTLILLALIGGIIAIIVTQTT
ncbi:syntaxin-7-like [Oscarella lobularis]|uniref:syntaxin-7-like n=1 Tax=Oscarella lobularis TaxID=121494 RepID=UPI0033132E99